MSKYTNIALISYVFVFFQQYIYNEKWKILHIFYTSYCFDDFTCLIACAKKKKKERMKSSKMKNQK